MPKTKISEFSSTPANNTDIDSINIAENCPPSGINDAIRELMSQLKDWQSGTSNDPMVIGSSGSLTLNQGTANGVTYLNGSKVVTSGSALTFDGTNLGVGIASPGTKLDVAGAVRSSVSGGTPIFYLSNGTTQHSIQNNSGSLAFYNDGTRGMDLTSTGLGIGTSSPATKLQVSANEPKIRITSTAGSGKSWDISSGGNTTVTLGHFSIYDTTTDAQRFNIVSGTGQMLLDGSGNLGLGVTPSAWGGGFIGFQIKNSMSLWSGTGSAAYYSNNVYYDGTSRKYVSSATAAEYEQGGGIHSWKTAASGTAGNAITFTQAMTLDASGNLGVGITNPNFVGGYTNFVVSNASNGGIVYVDRVGGARGYFYANGTTSVVLGNTSSIPLTFETNNTERARIDSSGNLLVGTTNASIVNSTSGAGGFNYFSGSYIGVATNSETTAFWNRIGTDGTVHAMRKNGTTVGTISVTGSATAYNTSSDYRLKNTIAPMTGALAKVAQLKPCTYKWNADGSDGQGFIAHELAEVVPQCVTGEKDAVDEEGNPKYQGIDTSFLVATLTAALQEAVAKINSLEARLDAANL